MNAKTAFRLTADSPDGADAPFQAEFRSQREIHIAGAGVAELKSPPICVIGDICGSNCLF